MKWIPNALTIGRCVFAVCVLVGVWQGVAMDPGLTGDLPQSAFERHAATQQLWYQFAFLAFLSGALTDFLDGWLARKLNAHSRFGVWLDPIADKLLIAAALLGLAMMLRTWLVYIPAAMIIARDVFITWFRTTPRGAAAVSPSGIAKWKTAVEMVALIGLMLPFALWPRSYVMADGDIRAQFITYVLVVLLWVAAGLSWWTGWLYVRPSHSAR